MPAAPRRRRGPAWLLATEAAVLLVVGNYALSLLGFRRLVRTLGHGGGASDPECVDRIAAVVDDCADRLGYTCLRRAFAAAWMLRLRGHGSTLHYGVARRDGASVAHAWLEAGGLPVVGQDRAGEFVRLASFPARATWEFNGKS